MLKMNTNFVDSYWKQCLLLHYMMLIDLDRLTDPFLSYGAYTTTIYKLELCGFLGLSNKVKANDLYLNV